MEESGHPVSGINYPGTFQDFDIWFSSENACLEYIAKLRWPKGFICPGCGEEADKPSLMGRGLFLCRTCKRQTSITAGTLFHGSHKPLLCRLAIRVSTLPELLSLARFLCFQAFPLRLPSGSGSITLCSLAPLQLMQRGKARRQWPVDGLWS